MVSPINHGNRRGKMRQYKLSLFQRGSAWLKFGNRGDRCCIRVSCFHMDVDSDVSMCMCVCVCSVAQSCLTLQSHGL